MTNPKLQRLRELNEARTKGPWIHGVNCAAEKGTFKFWCAGPQVETNTQAFNDVEFIAALANNADWLLACVEALEFYADPIIWKTLQPTGTPRDIRDFDGGERARKALGGGGDVLAKNHKD